ncbi:FoF1 ATP synthase subunit delta/epsilon [Blattabacterium cuenoti]|uniref:FoF1 ATP synthase subunit delta/epsilon n=1 Tax=Blattabacterium cuenoti TaxID=1653831 RepID=UPI00163BF4A2|nr:F0F1 ATP synthase subunit epsilon [Blattabacterium cuenoti]
MILKIMNSDKILYNGKIFYLKAPGLNGYFQILKNHTSFISVLKKGSIKFKNKNKIEQNISVESGLLKVINNLIVILL